MRFYTLIVILLLVASCNPTESTNNNNANYTTNRPPLIEKPYIEIPLGSIKPEGWLKMQLQSMADGMTGNLDELYPSVMGDNNGYLGGDGHAWERGPYWIDGLVPLAYTLDDKELIAKAQKWIEWSLQSQKENGFFGPYKGSLDTLSKEAEQKDSSRDWWPRMVMLKVFTQYYTATKDERVIDFMTKYFKFQYETLPTKPIGYYQPYWATARGGDNLMVIYWLYNITGDKFLLELAEMVHEQSYDWKNKLKDYKFMSNTFALHTVNLAQGIKEPIIYYQQNKNKNLIDAVDAGFDNIKRFHGWPTGLYGGDEHIHTANPTQGSEFCTAVELMFSLEKMIEITGAARYADHLERITFNALPTQQTDNSDSRQYYQQLNQIRISKEYRNFQTNYSGTDQLFGILTGYPCCTGNLHQGWPKFTAHLWYATSDGGVAAMTYSPNSVNVKVGDNVDITIKEDTFYPFNENIKFIVNIDDNNIPSVKFPFHFRIPEWCENPEIKVNNEIIAHNSKDGIQIIDRVWESGDIVDLTFPMKIKTSTWYEKSVSVERGPLLYALKIGEKWEKKEFNDSRFGDWYWEVHPTTKWNYGLVQSDVNNINDAYEIVINKNNGEYPWNIENAPIELKAKGKILPFWEEYCGSAGPQPYSVNQPWGAGEKGVYTDVHDITLIPYGCTTLRITEFPVVK